MPGVGDRDTSSDINMSQSDFTIVDAKIRYGLAGIRNVGEAAIDSIIQARQRRVVSNPSCISAALSIRAR